MILRVIKAALWAIGIICAVLAALVMAWHEWRGKFKGFFRGREGA